MCFVFACSIKCPILLSCFHDSTFFFLVSKFAGNQQFSKKNPQLHCNWISHNCQVMAAIRSLNFKWTENCKAPFLKTGIFQTGKTANYLGRNFELGVWHTNTDPWTKSQWCSVIKPHISHISKQTKRYIYLPLRISECKHSTQFDSDRWSFFFIILKHLQAEHIYVNRKLSNCSNESKVTYLHREPWNSWRGEVNSHWKLLPPWHLLVCARQSLPCPVYTF